MSFRVVLAHCRIQVLETLRVPGYVVPVLVFPPMFFLFFARNSIEGQRDANLFLASYMIYSILGAIFYLLVGGIAEDRQLTWKDYLRTLPAGRRSRLAGRVGVSLLAAAAASLLVIGVAWSTPFDLGLRSWAMLGVVALAGAIPFGLLGIAIAFWIQPNAALSIGNVLYFTLVFAGGIWTLPRGLPGWVQSVSPYLPTRIWGELAWGAAGGSIWAPWQWAGLLIYTIAFAAIAFLGVTRRENARYH